MVISWPPNLPPIYTTGTSQPLIVSSGAQEIPIVSNGLLKKAVKIKSV